jgi:hypothetical protein
MDADQLLQSLGVALGLPDLCFDANGCARVAVDGAPAVNFERDEGGGIHVYSVLGPLPREERGALYAQLLQGNLFGSTTAGATLAVDADYGEVILCRTFMAELSTAPAFAAAVEAFVGAAEDWQVRIARAPSAGSHDGAAPAMRQGMDAYLRG